MVLGDFGDVGRPIFPIITGAALLDDLRHDSAREFVNGEGKLALHLAGDDRIAPRCADTRPLGFRARRQVFNNGSDGLQLGIPGDADDLDRIADIL